MTHLYVHIPFCTTICSYCDFAKVLSSAFDIDQYLDQLHQELLTKATFNGYDTIYIGGGTPTALSNEQLAKLFAILKPYCQNTTEFTIEMNVETMNDQKLALIHDIGINRISIGVQTFKKELLDSIERNHDAQMVEIWLKKIKQIGIVNVSVDMMYALPYQTLQDVQSDLDILELYVHHEMIKHVSYYALQLEEGTKYHLANVCELQDDLQLDYYKKIEQRLLSMDIYKYEISNFAVKGYESIHNSAYWQNKEYSAIGLGAHGYENQIRYENTKSMTNYLKGNYRLSENFQTKKDMMEDYLIFGLRMVTGVNKDYFYESFNEHLEDVFCDINVYISSGQLIESNGNVFVHPDYFFSMHFILENFLL